jgi:hypothetical protein
MDLNIEPIKIYKIIRNSGKPRKDEIIRCIEMMAWEAEELSVTWEELIKLSDRKRKITKNEKGELPKSNLFSENTPLYGRLLHFYRNISTELGSEKSSDWIEKIYNQIANVILYNSDINKSIEEFKKTRLSRFPLYLSSQNNGSEIKDLASSLKVLQNEVAILESLPEILKKVRVN